MTGRDDRPRDRRWLLVKHSLRARNGATPVRLRHVEFRQVSRVGSLSVPGRRPGLYAGAGLDLPAVPETVLPSDPRLGTCREMMSGVSCVWEGDGRRFWRPFFADSASVEGYKNGFVL